MKPLLEICIDSFASAAAAQQGGADRLEVCNSLAVGGTTPSVALVEECVNQLQIPTMVMIRPHDGGFVYTDDDLRIMQRDIRAVKAIGVQGVVFGALTPSSEIDKEVCKRILEGSAGLQTTFHRAFDMTKDPFQSLALLESLGFDRILTSGQQPTAVEGQELICELNRQSFTISIMPGSGINPSNARQLIQDSGVSEIHASASENVPSIGSPTEVSFGHEQRQTTAEIVSALKNCFEA